MPLLDLNVQATSRLGLEPIKDSQGNYLYHGCVPTVISGVQVVHQDHTKGEFKDMKVPVLQVEFENYKFNPAEPDRFYTHSFKVVGSKQLVTGTTDQYTDRTEADVIADTQDLWKGIKHFLESLIGSPNYRNIANIPKPDLTKYFDLPGIAAPADRIKAYEDFFNYIAEFVNGDGKDRKSQIVTTDNKPLPLWIKMLPNYDKDPKRNAKYYAISRFINQGVFETLKLDKGIPVAPKVIRVKPTENLELSKVGTSAPGAMPGGSASPIPGGIDPEVAKLLGK